MLVSRLKLIGLAALCAVTMVPVVGRAGLEHFFLISGKKVVLKDNADPSKRKAIFISKDPLLTFSGINRPTDFGMYLRFSGRCLGTSVFYLPTTHWVEKNGKFKYKDKDGVDGPVRTAIAKAGFVKLIAKGSQLDFPLIDTGPQGRLTVFVDTQETSWTAFFGADNSTIKKDDSEKGVFSAVDATAAVPPGSSCEGAFI
jgi:hypothetical protein